MPKPLQSGGPSVSSLFGSACASYVHRRALLHLWAQTQFSQIFWPKKIGRASPSLLRTPPVTQCYNQHMFTDIASNEPSQLQYLLELLFLKETKRKSYWKKCCTLMVLCKGASLWEDTGFLKAFHTDGTMKLSIKCWKAGPLASPCLLCYVLGCFSLSPLFSSVLSTARIQILFYLAAFEI